MDASDFRRVEQELQHQLHPMLHTKGLQYTQGWSTASLGITTLLDSTLYRKGFHNQLTDIKQKAEKKVVTLTEKIKRFPDE